MDEFTETNREPRQEQAWLRAILESAAQLSLLSHAIRKPAEAVGSVADLLWEPHPGGSPQQDVEVFRRAAADLLNNVLDLANMESGHFEMENIAFDLKAVADQTIERLRPAAQAKKLVLKSIITPGVPGTLTGDPARLQQIVAQLLAKAIEFAEKGEIALSVRADPSSQNHLYFEVTRTDRSTPTKAAISGLELCYSIALVRKMGGDLQVGGEPGKGSLFTFDVVFASSPQGNERISESEISNGSAGTEERQTSKSASVAPQIHPPRTRVIRLLIAEDSEDSRFLLQEFLRKGPYEITFVENGRLALEAARSWRFDLILMDIQMPVMDGLAATRLIREAEQQAGRASTPLLALTANARKADIELSRAAGCNAHVLKPISRTELLNTIEKYLPLPATPEKPPSVEICIPPGLEEAARRYITSRNKDVSRLQQLLDGRQFDQLRILAHDMKGTGTSYGFPDLTRLGRLMECSAKEQKAEDLSIHMLEFRHYVQEAAQVVASRLESAAIVT